MSWFKLHSQCHRASLIPALCYRPFLTDEGGESTFAPAGGRAHLAPCFTSLPTCSLCWVHKASHVPPALRSGIGSGVKRHKGMVPPHAWHVSGLAFPPLSPRAAVETRRLCISARGGDPLFWRRRALKHK